MSIYELRYCDCDGREFAIHDFEADSDGAAIARGRFLARLKSPKFEVWNGDRLVLREIIAAVAI